MASEGSTSLTNDKAPADKEEDVDTGNSKYGIHIRHLAGIMVFTDWLPSGTGSQFQPAIPDGRISFHQW